MEKTVTRTIQITGEFPVGLFTDWICHRARVLDLAGWVSPVDDNLIEALISGNAILLDAFEVACSLGPVAAHVASIRSCPSEESCPTHPFSIRTSNKQDH